MFKKIFVFVIALMLLSGFGCSDNQENNERQEVKIEKKETEAVPLKAWNEEKEFQEKEEEKALKIGVIGPETGKGAEYGLSVLEGVSLAAKRFNLQGGIDGKNIEILHYDTRDDPGLTEKSVHDLIRQKAIAIFSAPTGWSTFGPVHLANQSRTLFISIGSRRRIDRSGPYIFRATLPDETATEDLIKHAMQNLGYTSYAAVTSSDYDYSLDVSALFKKAIIKHHGRLTVEADTYDTYSGQLDISAVVAALKKSPAPLHALVFTGSLDNGILLAKALKKAGLSLPVIGGEDLFTEEYLNKGKDAVQNSLLYASFSPHNPSPKTTAFMEYYRKEKSGVPNRFTALAYDTFMLLAGAIKTAGSTHSSKVKKTLVAIKDFSGVAGKMGFTPEGAPVKHPFIYRVEGKKFSLF